MTLLPFSNGAAGQLPAIHLLPDPSFFGDSFWERLKNVVAVVPVIMTAFVCQMSIHPLVSDLHDYTPRRMRTVSPPLPVTFSNCGLGTVDAIPLAMDAYLSARLWQDVPTAVS